MACPCFFICTLFKNKFLHNFRIKIFLLPSKPANEQKAILFKIQGTLENKMALCIMNINLAGEAGQ
jgi:hypothetical protein